MRIALPENIKAYARVFAAAGAPAYAVGGRVRNALLGLPPSDVDMASALTPEEVASLFTEAGAKIIEKAPELGTVEIHFEGIAVEHTTFRGESYSEGGEHRPQDVWFSGRLFDDAFRRDFTVNALYADLASGEIIDPTGGLADLDRRVLRTTSDNPDDILRSDALRVLRLARFSAELGFEIEEKTFLAAKRNAPKLADIAAERKRDELTKLLLADRKYHRPAGAVYEGLKLFDALGCLDEMLPELALGRGMEQRKDMHKYTVLEHALHTCEAAPAELMFRLAGLLHDVGKPRVFLDTGRYLGHDRVGEPIARNILTRLKYPAGITNDVCQLVKFHMYDVQGTAKENTLRTKFGEWGRELTRRLIIMRETDIHGCGTDDTYVAERWRALLLDMDRRNTPFTVQELQLTGEDVMREMHLPPSPEIGRILDALWRHCLVTPEDNTIEKLAALMKTV